MVARPEAVDRSDPGHNQTASSRRKHWSISNRTYTGRSARNRKRRVKDHGARSSIPGKAGANDRSLSPSRTGGSLHRREHGVAKQEVSDRIYKIDKINS